MKIFYTPEQEKWLVENYNRYETYMLMAVDFNRLFNANRKVESIREKCTKRLGIKGITSQTSYKKGNLQKQCPIGTIRKTSAGNYIKVADSQYSFQTGYAEPYWLPIQKKVWIDHYGEVPDGKMVIFLDCNRENLDIKNLYCIDRRISAILANNKWYSNNAEVTMTAIKWCELYYAINKLSKMA